MRKISVVLSLLFITVLSGCTTIQKDDFIYFDGYKDEEIKYFDEYAVVYQSDQYDFVIYAVKSENILDENNEEFVNYLLKWDIEDFQSMFFGCEKHSLYGGSQGWSKGTNIELITGQEVYDYCMDQTIFTLAIEQDNEITIDVSSFENDIDVEWLSVEDVESNQTRQSIIDNLDTIIGLVIVIVLVIGLGMGYIFYYKRNYNKFTTGEKVRKLPSIGVFNVGLLIIALISSLIIFSNHEDARHKRDSNFYDYEQRESSMPYIPLFENDGYELIGANGNQEVYFYEISDDKQEIIFVLVDGDTRYEMDRFMSSYPGASDVDYFRVDLYQKEGTFGFIFGHVVAGYKEIDGEDVQVFAISLGDTRQENGETFFVDFRDENDSGWTEIYKNRKGYIKMNIIKSFW